MIQTIQKWFDKAEADLDSIEILLPADKITTYGVICYLSQQTAEKYIKGFLVFKGIEPPKVHDLKYLIAQCKPDLDTLKENAELLNDYIVESRYPMITPVEYVKERVQQAYEATKEIKHFILEAIKNGE